MAVLQGLLDAVDVEAVLLEGDADPVDPEPVQHQQRPVVGGLLDDDLVAGLEQVVEEHPARLERAVGDHHAGGIDSVMLGDPLAEAGVADAGAVGEGPGGVGIQRAGGGLTHGVDGQQVGAGRAAGE